MRHHSVLHTALGALFVVLLAVLGTTNQAEGHVIERVSLDSTGNEANGPSTEPAVSGDGRYVAFESGATNLVAGDTNAAADIFFYDRVTKTIERLSVDSNGNQSNEASSTPVVSADGRYVAFISEASNLVSDDTNDRADVFVRDRATGITERVSIGGDGSEVSGGSSIGYSISGDGRFVPFWSSGLNLPASDGNYHVYLRDRLAATTDLVSSAYGTEARISDNGAHLSFTTLVGGQWQIVAHDRAMGSEDRVDVDSSGTPANSTSLQSSISADGRYVVFESRASNLVLGDTNTCFGLLAPGSCIDIFVHDRVTGLTERVSVDSAGTQANSRSILAIVSPDGRYVGFTSYASNLVPGDTNGVDDTFVHDRLTGRTERVNVDSEGGEANGESPTNSRTAFGDGGSVVAFASDASNLVLDDTNNVRDIFVVERGTAPTRTPTATLTITSTRTIITTPTPLSESSFSLVLSYARLRVDTSFSRDNGSIVIKGVVNDTDHGGDLEASLLAGAATLAVDSPPAFAANMVLSNCARAGKRVKCLTGDRLVRAVFRPIAPLLYRATVRVRRVGTATTGASQPTGPVQVRLTQSAVVRPDDILACNTRGVAVLVCRE